MISARQLAAATADGGSLVPVVLLVLPLLMLAWLWVTTRRRARATEARSQALAPGQRVVTTSGLIGTLESREAGVARLEVAPGVILSIDERALMGEASSVIPQPTGGTTADPTAPSKEAH